MEFFNKTTFRFSGRSFDPDFWQGIGSWTAMPNSGLDGCLDCLVWSRGVCMENVMVSG